MVRIARHFKLVSTQVSETLILFSLSKSEIEKVLPLLEEHRGKRRKGKSSRERENRRSKGNKKTNSAGTISFLSLHGIKDIILGSTGAPMPLLHLHWGSDKKNSEYVERPRREARKERREEEEGGGRGR
jgi:hypothetical protein